MVFQKKFHIEQRRHYKYFFDHENINININLLRPNSALLQDKEDRSEVQVMSSLLFNSTERLVHVDLR